MIGTAVATVAGGLYGASQSRKAAKTQASAAEDARALQERMYNEQMAKLDPFQRIGLQAQTELRDQLLGKYAEPQEKHLVESVAAGLTTDREIVDRARRLGYTEPNRISRRHAQPTTEEIEAANAFISKLDANNQAAYDLKNPMNVPEGVGERDFSSFYNTPGYQFALEQGQRTLEASNAARGLSTSGAAQKALVKYGVGMANQQYDTYLNRLAGLGGTGQTAVISGLGASQAAANQIGGAIQNIGEARASGYASNANIAMGTVNQLGGLYAASQGAG